MQAIYKGVDNPAQAIQLAQTPNDKAIQYCEAKLLSARPLATFSQNNKLENIHGNR